VSGAGAVSGKGSADGRDPAARPGDADGRGLVSRPDAAEPEPQDSGRASAVDS
jgi:hypothetical protein